MAAADKDRSTRLRILRTLDKALDKPMIVLALVWLVLMVLDLTHGLSAFGETLTLVIWAVFVLEFVVSLAIAPNKWKFIGRHWLTALALLVPALRVLRPLRFLRVFRSAQVVRVVGSLNRGMGALSRAMGRRGFGYVAILTLAVAFGGAAGMYAFEKEGSSGGFESYPDALWWTAMILTTTGSSAWPETAEGRVLGFLLALYAFSVFGYIAATLASFFVEQDAAASDAETVGKEQLSQVLAELREIRRARNA